MMLIVSSSSLAPFKLFNLKPNLLLASSNVKNHHKQNYCIHDAAVGSGCIHDAAVGSGCISISHQMRRWILRNSNQEVVETSLSTSVDSASTVVRKFYEGINGHDLASVENLIAENCVYEDLIFPQPFVGRKAILEFFKKFIDSISTDLQFVIDDLSENDASGVGVTWHLEWKGRPFPFSKGCSFYRLEVLNGQRQIIYGRDSVEPAIKPGESALVAIRGVTWLLQQFPQLAERL